MLEEKEGIASLGELSALAGRFGWSVNPEQVSQAANFLQALGLVQLKESKPR